MSIKTFKPSAVTNKGLLAHLSLSKDPISASHAIDKGLESGILQVLIKVVNIDAKTVMKVAGVDRATVARHLKNKTVWRGASAIKIYNTARIVESALELFDGDKEQVDRWLNTPAIALNGVTPADYSRLPLGQEAVLELLERIKHGVVI